MNAFIQEFFMFNNDEEKLAFSSSEISWNGYLMINLT